MKSRGCFKSLQVRGAGYAEVLSWEGIHGRGQLLPVRTLIPVACVSETEVSVIQDYESTHLGEYAARGLHLLTSGSSLLPRMTILYHSLEPLPTIFPNSWHC